MSTNMTAKNRSRQQAARRKRGLGLVEMVICLTISSLLLTATGTAYFAGFNSYRDNLSRGNMLSSGRACLSSIVRDIRMGDGHVSYDPNSTTNTNELIQFTSGLMPGNTAAGLPANGGSGVIGIKIIKTHADTQDPNASTSTPVTILYWLDTTNKQIMTSRTLGNATPSTSVVCSGVNDFRLYLQPIYIPYDPATGAAAAWGLQRASMTLTLANSDANGNKITAGGQNVNVTLTNSASPRRNFSMH